MAQGHRPATALIDFIREAGQRGRYNNSQMRLYGTAVALIIRNAPDRRSLTVDELEQRLTAVTNPFSPDSLKEMSLASYRSRVKRVLKDFRRWSGDYDTWQASELAKSSKTKQLSLQAPPPTALTQIQLPGGHDAELRYPSELGVRDLEALSILLKSIAEHLSVQAAALKKGEGE